MPDRSYHFAGAPSQKDDGGFGIGDALMSPLHLGEHLATDVVQAAAGMPAGMFKLLTDPREASKAIGMGIVNDWAPLFMGHPGEWLENTYEHPLGPILDIASFVTLGAGAAARGAAVVSKAAEAGRVARATEGLVAAGEKRVGPLGARTAAENTALKQYPGIPGVEALQLAAKDAAAANPTVFDRLAAYGAETRGGKATRQVKDNPAAPLRNKFQPEVRFPYDIPAGRTVASRARQEAVAGLLKNIATRGDTLGKMAQGFEQFRYERARLMDMAAGSGAIQALLSDAMRTMTPIFDKADPMTAKIAGQSIAKSHRNNAMRLSIHKSQIIERGEKIADKAYGPIAKEEYLLKPRRTRAKDEAGEYIMDEKGQHTYVSRDPFAGDIDQFGKDFQQMGSRIIANNPKHVDWIRGKELKKQGITERNLPDGTKVPIKDAAEYAVLANRHTLANFGRDLNSTMSMAHGMLGGIVKLQHYWKTILLMSGRFFANNMLGNAAMQITAFGGPGTIFGWRESMKYIRGQKRALDVDVALERALGDLSGDWLHRYFADQFPHGLYMTAGSAETAKRLSKGTVFEDLPRTKLDKVADKWFTFTGKWTDTMPRIAAIQQLMRRHPIVKAEMEKLGKGGVKWSDEKLFTRAAENALRKNPNLRAEISKQVNDVMGDYLTLSQSERYIRNLGSPFYTWQRHIFRNGRTMFLDRPVRAAAMNKLGEMGYDATTDWLGDDVPDFLRSSVPFFDLPGGGEGRGRKPILSMTGLNPYQQLGDEANIARSIMGIASGDQGAPTLGETFGSLLSPSLQTGAQLLSGGRLLTGQPVSARQTLFSPEFSPFLGLSPLQFAQRQTGIGTTKSKSPSLYGKSPSETLYSWLGIPYKELYLQRARALGLAEAKEKAGG